MKTGPTITWQLNAHWQEVGPDKKSLGCCATETHLTLAEGSGRLGIGSTIKTFTHHLIFCVDTRQQTLQISLTLDTNLAYTTAHYARFREMMEKRGVKGDVNNLTIQFSDLNEKLPILFAIFKESNFTDSVFKRHIEAKIQEVYPTYKLADASPSLNPKTASIISLKGIAMC